MRGGCIRRQNFFQRQSYHVNWCLKLILSLFVLKMKVTSERLCIHWDVDGDVGRVCGDLETRGEGGWDIKHGTRGVWDGGVGT